MTQKKRSGNGSRVRNRVASNPLLGKSGRHEKSRKAIRRKDKVKLSTMRFERAAVVASGQSRIVQLDNSSPVDSTRVHPIPVHATPGLPTPVHPTPVHAIPLHATVSAECRKLAA